jgi:hypothetical protein
MSALSSIKSNTCPYCGAPYTIADGGCRAKCRLSEVSRKLIAAALHGPKSKRETRGRVGAKTQRTTANEMAPRLVKTKRAAKR